MSASEQQSGMERKKPTGRPTLYRDEYPKQATKICRLGATDKDLADFFGVSEDTINEWKKAHPAFSESLKEGKGMADAEVADRLFRRATGYEHESVKIMQYEGSPVIVPFIEKYAPDTTACIFWLKNRRPDLWRDRVSNEISGPNGGPIQTNAAPLAPDEQAALSAYIESVKSDIKIGGS